MTALDELRPGLWRWTAKHPAWRARRSARQPRRLARGRRVASPTPRRRRSCSSTRSSPTRAARSSHDLDALVERTDGPSSIAADPALPQAQPRRARAPLRRPLAGDPGPGVEPVPIAGAGETMVWLPEPRALIPGDRLIGDGRGGLRMSPGLVDALPRAGPGGAGRGAAAAARRCRSRRCSSRTASRCSTDGRAAIERAIGG